MPQLIPEHLHNVATQMTSVSEPLCQQSLSIFMQTLCRNKVLVLSSSFASADFEIQLRKCSLLSFEENGL